VTGLVLVLRPAPGAEATAARAADLGLRPVIAPLFSVGPLPWTAPDPAGFDAVMFTSANAARHGGDGLTSFHALACYATGEATAEAASEAGFGEVQAGPSDGTALLAMMEAQGVRRAFHPCGRDRTALPPSRVELVDVAVYASEPVRALPPEAEAALARHALVLVHSPRAGRLLDALYAGDRASIAIVAISEAAAEAIGTGWKSVHAAAEPREHALLELAAKLCHTADE
jgi:uroporphyrinogen-III synthase